MKKLLKLNARYSNKLLKTKGNLSLPLNENFVWVSKLCNFHFWVVPYREYSVCHKRK